MSRHVLHKLFFAIAGAQAWASGPYKRTCLETEYYSMQNNLKDAPFVNMRKLQMLGVVRALAYSGKNLTQALVLHKMSRGAVSFVQLVSDPLLPERRKVDQAWLR
eukprot:scaffold59078_cov51-Prasinocladus_malaysianus.AAC.1